MIRYLAMNVEDIKTRAAQLLEQANQSQGSEMFKLYNGTLSLMTAFYGNNSIQLKAYVRDAEQVRENIPGAFIAKHIYSLALGALKNLASEVEAGFTGTLQKLSLGKY